VFDCEPRRERSHHSKVGTVTPIRFNPVRQRLVFFVPRLTPNPEALAYSAASVRPSFKAITRVGVNCAASSLSIRSCAGVHSSPVLRVYFGMTIVPRFFEVDFHDFLVALNPERMRRLGSISCNNAGTTVFGPVLLTIVCRLLSSGCLT
jgi:hypothetical protein